MTRTTGRMRHGLSLAAALAMSAALTACTTPSRNTAALTPTAEHPCPPWVEFPADRNSNADSAYLGCSVDYNLKATLEDPRDYEHGRELGPASGARESLGVAQYQTGQVKPLQAAEPATPTIVLGGAGGTGQ